MTPVTVSAGSGLCDVPDRPRKSRSPGGVGDRDGAGPLRTAAKWTAAALADALGRPRPTSEQVAVIEAPCEPLLVVAGAGSGKTETMAARVVWLVANRLLGLDQVLGLTFTRKAAGELAERIAGRLRRLAPLLPGVWDELESTAQVSTYHSYAANLLTDHGLLIGLEPDTRLLTEASAWQYAHDVVSCYDGPMNDVEAAESTVTCAVLALAGELAEHLQPVQAAARYLGDLEELVTRLPAGSARGGRWPGEVATLMSRVAARRQLLPLVAAYQRRKAERGVVDFADQVALATRLVGSHPEVAEAQRARYRAVLLDEVQDTSEAQLCLLHAVFAAPGPGRPSPVTAVGDPHQAIYGWRGASAATMHRFRRDFAGDGVAEVSTRSLSTSWRNDRAVLAAANVIAEPLRRDAPVPVARVRAAPGAGRGRLHVARLSDGRAEAEYVARWLAHRWAAPGSSPDAGQVASAGGGENRPGRTAAVLCRRRAQFPAVVAALQAAGLPVEVIGLGGLLTTPEVADLVALLTAIADPGRGDALMRLLTGPMVRLGAADLDALGAWAACLAAAGGPAHESDSAGRPGVCLAEAIETLPPGDWCGPEGETLGETARVRLAWLADVTRTVRAQQARGLVELVAVAERVTGLDVEVAARGNLTEEAARRNLDAFADVASSFAATADHATLGGFVAWLDAARSQERGLEAPAGAVSEGSVQVLTIHAAKGLEWDVVAIPGLVEGSFPAGAAVRSSWRDGRWNVPPDRHKGWYGAIDALPYDLRGDRGSLPELDWRTCADLTELNRRLCRFTDADGARLSREERRLCYVALTRARHEVLLSAAVRSEANSVRVTSRFLLEVTDHPQLALERGPWIDLPTPDEVEAAATSPGVGPDDEVWPARPALSAERNGVLGAARRVSELLHEQPVRADGGRWRLAAGENATDDQDLELDRLLAEHRRSRQPSPALETSAVVLPDHLSVSQFAQWCQCPDGFRRQLRRPMPRPPDPATELGTRFHAWIERHYRRAELIELDGIPGSADPASTDPASTDPALGALVARFLGSPWAHQRPLLVEEPFDMVIGAVGLRGRVDAVFTREGQVPGKVGDRPGGVVVVDWKSGRPPGEPELATHAMQLGVYRRAVSQLLGLPADAVSACCYYAETGRTVFPPLPPEEAILAWLGAGAGGGGC